MNENNRQFGYSSQQNKTNYYIDDIRFDASRSEPFAKQRRISYVIDRFAASSDILNILRPDSQYIKYLRADVTNYPSRYGVDVMTFLRAYEKIFVVINNICLNYNQTGQISDKVFSRGFSVLNEKLYEDLVDNKASSKAVVNAIVIMGNSLAPLNTNVKEGPNDERSY